MKTSRLVALVSGAGSGIGEATALALVRAGINVFAGGRRVDRLAALQKAANGASATLHTHPLDVRSRDSVEAFAAAARTRFERIDILVNNAGVMPLSPLFALRVDEWDWTLDVNVRGVNRAGFTGGSIT